MSKNLIIGVCRGDESIPEGTGASPAAATFEAKTHKKLPPPGGSYSIPGYCWSIPETAK